METSSCHHSQSHESGYDHDENKDDDIDDDGGNNDCVEDEDEIRKRLKLKQKLAIHQTRTWDTGIASPPVPMSFMMVMMMMIDDDDYDDDKVDDDEYKVDNASRGC